MGLAKALREGINGTNRTPEAKEAQAKAKAAKAEKKAQDKMAKKAKKAAENVASNTVNEDFEYEENGGAEESATFFNFFEEDSSDDAEELEGYDYEEGDDVEMKKTGSLSAMMEQHYTDGSTHVGDNKTPATRAREAGKEQAPKAPVIDVLVDEKTGCPILPKVDLMFRIPNKKGELVFVPLEEMLAYSDNEHRTCTHGGVMPYMYGQPVYSAAKCPEFLKEITDIVSRYAAKRKEFQKKIASQGEPIDRSKLPFDLIVHLDTKHGITMDDIVSGTATDAMIRAATLDYNGKSDIPVGTENTTELTEKKSDDSWDCVCGRKHIIGKFCPSCRAERPVALKPGQWKCRCKQVNEAADVFCCNCGEPRPVVLKDGQWRCPNPNCNQINGAEDNYCPGCSEPKPEASKPPACKCGWIIKPGANFCPSCRAKIAPQLQKSDNDQGTQGDQPDRDSSNQQQRAENLQKQIDMLTEQLNAAKGTGQ